MHKRNYLSFFLFMGFVVSIASCKKSEINSEKDLYENSPSTAIPAVLKQGLWFWGSLSPVSYYDQNGHEVGNDWEAAREYSFTEAAGQGRLEFIQYLGTRNASNCVTEIFTTKKGTIVFEGADKFIFYPVEGSFKTVKKGCSNNSTTTRKATAGELVPETYLWEVKSFTEKPLLYIYESTDIGKEDPVFVYQNAQ